MIVLKVNMIVQVKVKSELCSGPSHNQVKIKINAKHGVEAKVQIRITLDFIVRNQRER